MYDREVELRTAFNGTVQKLLDVPHEDYYSKLAIDQILELKTALSNIHNIVTLRLAISLGGWICSRYNLADQEARDVQNAIRASKPNTNGYDIEIFAPDIVAEAKCNIPINGGFVYGAAQKYGLIKDITGLLNGKSKSTKNPANSIKLLGLYDCEAVRGATKHLISSRSEELKSKIEIDPHSSCTLEASSVYIVYLK